MSNNKFLADYAYLAEASYADFVNGYAVGSVVDTLTKSKKQGGLGVPESFAKLVTNNYEVMAHYKDRGTILNNIFGSESGFSGTLFKGKVGTENAGNYVIC